MAQQKRGDSLNQKEKEKILSDIQSGVTFKSIANKYRIDIGNVNKIAKMNNIHGCNGSGAIKHYSVQEITPIIPNSKTATDLTTVENQNSTENDLSWRKKPKTKIPDEYKLKVAGYIEQQYQIDPYMKLDMMVLMDMFKLSYISICRICHELAVKIPGGGFNNVPKRKITNNKTNTQKSGKVNKEEIQKVLDKEEKVKEESNVIKNDVVEVNYNKDPKREKVFRCGYELTKITEDSTIIRAGLCCKRHELPTELSVFQEITSDKMFNFDLLKKEANQFIDEWIPQVNGLNTRKLEIYATGLTIAHDIFIPICAERQVNLTMYHYNTATATYVPLVIYDKFPMYDSANSAIYKFLLVNRKNDSIFTFNCEIDDFKNGSNFYIVRKFIHKSSTSKDPSRIENIICKELNDTFDIYGKIVEEFLVANTKNTGDMIGKVTISNVNINMNGFVKWGNCLSTYVSGLKVKF